MSRRGRILVVEDDAVIREQLSGALRAAGAIVDVAEDGPAGLERLRAGPAPAAILLDVQRLGVETFVRTVREDPRYDGVAVVTMSSADDPDDMEGVLAPIRKPFDLPEILEILLSLSEADVA